MNTNLDLGAALRLADDKIGRLEVELEAARRDRAILQEAVEAVRRMNAAPAVQQPRSPTPPPVTEKSEVNNQILKVLTSDPIPLAELQKRILESGYKPKGQYFEAALRKALKRLGTGKREMVGSKVIDGRNFYFRQK